MVGARGDETVWLSDVARWMVGDRWLWWGMWDVGPVLFWSLISCDGDIWGGEIEREVFGPPLQRLHESLPVVREGEDDGDRLNRTMNGLLSSPDSEQQLARDLGAALIPDVLTDLLSSDHHYSGLVVSPAPSLARVPYELLAHDEDRRLCEALVVVGGAPIALADAARRGAADGRAERAVLVVDPDPTHRVLRSPTLPESWRALPGAADHLGSTSVDGEPATRDRIRRQLEESVVRAGSEGLFGYFGHVSLGDRQNPSAGGLLLADGLLTAQELLLQPEQFPMPSRCVVIGCSSAGGTNLEWIGLPAALFGCGAKWVSVTAWDLPNWPQTVGFAAEVLARCAEDGLDGHHEVNVLRRRSLDRWRAMTGGAATASDGPLVWGAVRTIGAGGRRDGG